MRCARHLVLVSLEHKWRRAPLLSMLPWKMPKCSKWSYPRRKVRNGCSRQKYRDETKKAAQKCCKRLAKKRYEVKDDPSSQMIICDPHFQRLTGLPPEGTTLRCAWFWRVTTLKRPSQVTRTLACCIQRNGTTIEILDHDGINFQAMFHYICLNWPSKKQINKRVQSL